MADREIIPQKSSAMPSPAIDGNVDSVSDSNGYGILSPIWTERLVVLKKPRVLISLFLASSAFYCFVIGRDRYISVSEFVVQQAAPLNTSSASVLAGAQQDPAAVQSDAMPATAAPQPMRRDMPKVGRNDPCPCGSNKKYKQCHGRIA